MDKFCYNCGSKNVIWGCDFDYEDYGYEGNGIVSNYSCTDCGAQIEVRVPIDDGDKENDS